MRLTQTEIMKHLREQTEFLNRSARAYDDGFRSEAKRLAVALRILLHDTGESTSLLTLLGRKDMLFYDTALNYDQQSGIPTHGLFMTQMGPGNVVQYVPPIDDGSPSRYQKGKVPFDDWWETVVLADAAGSKLTRREIVLAVANKDGGAHVDPDLDGAYANLTKLGGISLKYYVGDVEHQMATPPELASIRQIAHEVLKSLKDEFGF